jgi:NB-ARC domain
MAPILPYYQLRPHSQDPGFFDRPEILDRIDKALLPPNSRVPSQVPDGLRTFALCGMGGIGKTQLAVHFAFTRKAKFDAIFFLHADTAAKLADGFQKIAIGLSLASESDAGQDVISRDLVLEWLSKPSREPRHGSDDSTHMGDADANWLLIFDNADNLELLNEYWPVTGNGSVLVTSRDPLAKTHVYSNFGIDLPSLSDEEGGQLLQDITRYQSPEDIQLAKAISKRLGGLPLAITQIAGTLTRRDLTFKDFLEVYDQRSLLVEFHKTKIGLSRDGYEQTLYTVWPFQDLSKPATELLYLLALLDPDCIPEKLFTEHFQPLPLKNFPTNAKEYIEARVELSKSSLITRNKDHDELVIHRMIPDVAIARMAKGEFQNAFRSAVMVLGSSWPTTKNFNHGVARWRQCDPLIPHISLLMVHFEQEDPLKAHIQDRVSFAGLLNQAGR